MTDTPDSRGSLPPGSKGLDLGEAVLLFANGKLVITAKGAQEHLTIHFGAQSRTLDVHKTYTATDGSTKHVRLFTVCHENFPAMIQEIASPMLEAQTRVLRRLRPGWMAKQRVRVEVLGSLAESDILAIMKLRRRKLVIDQERLAARVWAPEYFEDLYELPDWQTFILFSCKRQRRIRMLGVGFKFTDATARRRLVWLSRRRVGQAFLRGRALLEKVAAKYGTFHEPLPWL